MEHGELHAGTLGEGGNLLGGSTLVGVHEGTELTTSAGRAGSAGVGHLDNAVELAVDTTVHAGLGSTVGDDLARDDSDLTTKTGLLVLHGSGQGHNLGGEVLAGVSHGSRGGTLSGSNVLHSLAEAGILEGGLLSELVVQVVGGTCKVLVKGSTLLGHGHVELAELAVGRAAGRSKRLVDGAEGLGVTGDGTSLGG